MNKKCYIIGDDSLIEHCARLLVRQQWQLLGVVTTNALVTKWCHINGIASFCTISDLEDHIAKKKIQYDFLFSISNRKILKKNLLKTPRQLSINYHNALLPKYGGVYATSWAILNDEKSHGITWHVMTEKIDQGGILLQKQFAIKKRETALSLNIRCHEEAKNSFEELITLITLNKIIPINKKEPFSYFSFADKVAHGGIVSWSNSIKYVDRLHRALSMKGYENRLGTVKFFLNTGFYNAKIIRFIRKNIEGSSGKVIAFTTRSISILVKDGIVQLSQLSTLDGKKITISDIIIKESIICGKTLKKYPKKMIKKFYNYSMSHALNEKKLVNLIRNSRPFILPYLHSKKKSQGKLEKSYIIKTINFANKIPSNFNKRSNFLFSVIVIYFYRLNLYEPYSVDILLDKLAHVVSDITLLISPYLPLNFDNMNDNMDVFDVICLITEKVEQLKLLGGYEKDVFSRYPDIQNKSPTMPMAICLSENAFQHSMSTYNICINIHEKKGWVQFYVNASHFLNKNISKTLERVQFQIENIIEQIKYNIYIKIKNLCILSKTELNSLSKKYNQIHCTGYPCPHQLFEAQASTNPMLIAISTENGDFSYSYINNKANQLANYLKKRAITLTKPICVSLTDTLFLMITILAVWKLGGLYVPINPTSPIEEVKKILSETKSILLITQSNLAKILKHYKIDKVFIDQYDTFNRFSSKNIENRPDYNNLSYIIYTSGSTGWPKGVQVTYRNISYSLFARIKYYQKHIFGTHNTPMSMLVLISYSFDASLGGLLWPIAIGGTVVAIRPKECLDYDALWKTIKKKRVTHIISFPALYENLLNKLNTKKYNITSLRTVILGGNHIKPSMLILHKKLLVKTDLFNEYGLTETTIQNTVEKLYDSKTRKIHAISIGKEMDNATTIFLLDKYRNFVPSGIEGEIYIGGPSITSGYLNDSKLTHHHFIKNDLFIDHAHHSRLFKTNDMAIYDGKKLILKGRGDEQIKIRGFRVNLNWIEKTIILCESVLKCAVIVQKFVSFDGSENTYLAAYLVPKSKKSIDLATLKKTLSTYLPDYAMPNLFFALKSLPLTPNGKIDKKALSKIKIEKSSDNFNKKPKNKIEKKIDNILKRILRISTIDTSKNFFELGGTSLEISLLLESINKSFKKKISLQAFLNNPTVKFLTHAVKIKKHPICIEDYLSKKLQQDLHLTPGITCHNYPKITEKNRVKTILITGVTGFIGIHLLEELYTHTDLTFYCLIRDKSRKHAFSRLRSISNYFKLNSKILNDFHRIKVVVGDFSKDKLNFKHTQFIALAKKIDSVVHCGAYVHHYYTYGQLRSNNVLSLDKILNFCITDKKKQLHYLSTLSIAPIESIGGVDTVTESAIRYPKKSSLREYTGYEITKYVAEYKCSQAMQRHIPVKVYRPCLILGHSKRMINPKNIHFLSILKHCIYSRMAPDWEITLNVLPIDFISKLLRVSILGAFGSNIFNIANKPTLTWRKLISHLNDHYHFGIEIVSSNVWVKESLKNINKKSVFFKLLPMYKYTDRWKLFKLSRDIFNRNTEKLMKKFNMNYPSPYQLLDKYVDLITNI